MLQQCLYLYAKPSVTLTDPALEKVQKFNLKTFSFVQRSKNLCVCGRSNVKKITEITAVSDFNTVERCYAGSTSVRTSRNVPRTNGRI